MEFFPAAFASSVYEDQPWWQKVVDGEQNMQAQHLQDELNKLSSGENGHLSKLDTDDG